MLPNKTPADAGVLFGCPIARISDEPGDAPHDAAAAAYDALDGDARHDERDDG